MEVCPKKTKKKYNLRSNEEAHPNTKTRLNRNSVEAADVTLRGNVTKPKKNGNNKRIKTNAKSTQTQTRPRKNKTDHSNK